MMKEPTPATTQFFLIRNSREALKVVQSMYAIPSIDCIYS